jgi:ligand-binding sensor domain-containing protein
VTAPWTIRTNRSDCLRKTYAISRVACTSLLCAVVFTLPFRLTAGRATFQEYGPEQGLNNVGLHTMIQDRAGYLWVGSDNGLFRYNGKSFQRYGEQHGLPSSVILSLGETGDGVLWVATTAGLARRAGDRFLPDGPNVSVELPDETNLAFDSKDRLYVGTSHGLLVGSPGVGGAPRKFQLQPGATGSIAAVHVDPGGVVWFGCERKLCRLAGKAIEVIGPEQGLPADVWQSILTDRDGKLWVRSANRLLMRKRGAANFTNEKNLPATSAAATLFLDRAGHVLVPSDVGLARWHAGSWELVDARRGLASNAVTCVFQDRDGALWLGLRGVGAARWLGYNLAESWTMADGLASPIIWAIEENGKGVWVGTDQGLNFLPNHSSQWRTWTSRQGLPGDHVSALATDPDGSIWIGTFPGGVARLDPESGQVRKYGIESGLASNSIFGLTFDREGRLWVSAAGGLFRSTGSGRGVRFEKQLPFADGLKETFRQVVEDSLGRIWVAGSRGLKLFEKGKWRRFGKSEGLEGDHTTQLAETADGAIWIAYNDALGLSRLTWSNGAWKVQHLTEQDEGLPSDNVVFLGSDVRGCLWAGTDKGVAAFDGKTWHRYGHEDGLISDYPNPNAFEAAANGNIWIGTARGLTRLRPSDWASAGQPPP